ncbi:hypothetical protein [Vreelandella venusta]|uniref:Uncharacterized protein n=1 Tax=Vreelandella venusta TaxID=44935 RepID=A0AAQ0CJ82_9GAMM|nr:hypothetical protein [Halomonas venusta]QRL05156.1 hypothetical protein JDS37_09585 [Halomonas venusta]GEK50926.1 hypothetical protein HVE01_16470 [Halomonas venusta]
MRTISHLSGSDRLAALEAMSKAVSERVSKACLGTSESARVTAEAMLEGVAVLDGLSGPVVLLRASLSDSDLADELEALAANYRQRHAENEAAEADLRRRHVNNAADSSLPAEPQKSEPEQNQDPDKFLPVPVQRPSEPPNRVDEND